MAGYSNTPLWKKLGYKPGMSAFVSGAPANYSQILELPREIAVEWLPKSRAGVNLSHLYPRDQADLKRQLASVRKLMAVDGMVWVSWPKKASGLQSDVNEDVVRQAAFALGMVDIKVCAVDEIWSGLKLVIRKSERGGARCTKRP